MRLRSGLACQASIIRSTVVFMDLVFSWTWTSGQKLNSFDMSISGHWPGCCCHGSLDFSWTGLT
jgi:hypothetical protein